MKNVIMKSEWYKDYGMFSHIYLLDVDYDFNDKSIEDIMDFVNSDPLSPIMIHTNDITYDLVEILKKMTMDKEIWFEIKNELFENIADFPESCVIDWGILNIDYIVDALGDEIDYKRSVVFNELIKYDTECPF